LSSRADELREIAARIAEDEEKKRKRAEKFGTGAPATANGSSEPVSASRARSCAYTIRRARWISITEIEYEHPEQSLTRRRTRRRPRSR
jgi:hypothetical protein